MGQGYSSYTKTLTASCPADVGWKYAGRSLMGKEERRVIKEVSDYGTGSSSCETKELSSTSQLN